MKKQLDNKWRQLDQFETSVRKLELVKTSWRNKFAQKEGEIAALQVSLLLPSTRPPPRAPL